MILVRISAEDIRIVQHAKSLEELQGVRQMFYDRIEQSRLMKEMGAKVGARVDKFRWKEALAVAKEVLGDECTFPKLTDYRWYQRVNSAIMHEGMDAEFVTKLANYCKENMRMPIKFEFMICMHDRIMKGEYDNQKANSRGAAGASQTLASVFGTELPEE